MRISNVMIAVAGGGFKPELGGGVIELENEVIFWV
jgi:hypothetical protein